ncbi:hypothetical protein C8R46DRAFT_1226842 [Mycena filopes]|nr:hypothetical protein C8R46DRAFT_1226842 [Mycena filopes]
MIQSLCVELVQEIAKELPRTAQKDLRAACRYIEAAVAPLFFSFVVLNTEDLQHESAIWGLQHLATGESGWSMHAKTLKIFPCSPVDWDDEVPTSDGEVPISDGALEALFTAALGSLKNVRHVRWVITVDDPSWQRDVVAEYLRLLPLLTSLEICSWTRDFSVPRFSGLRRLKIMTHALNLTESDFRAITHNHGLTSLTLSLGSTGTEDIPAHFWHILRENGVHLREISTTFVSTDLRDYLCSYSGVEKLSLDSMGWESISADYNICAKTFYETVFPHHAESLVKLTCPIGDEDSWTFGTHNVAAISQLSRLVYLRIGVAARGTVWRVDEEVNVLDLLFDTASAALPDLRTLLVSPCYRSGCRDEIEAEIAQAFQARYGHPYTGEFGQPPPPIVKEGVIKRLRLRWATWIEDDGVQKMAWFLLPLDLGITPMPV